MAGGILLVVGQKVPFAEGGVLDGSPLKNQKRDVPKFALPHVWITKTVCEPLGGTETTREQSVWKIEFAILGKYKRREARTESNTGVGLGSCPLEKCPAMNFCSSAF